MALLRHINRLKYIDFLIRRKKKGNLQTLAQKNHLCKRAMAKIWHEMKELGFSIQVDRIRSTYFYAEEGKLVDCFFSKKRGSSATNNFLIEPPMHLYRIRDS